MESPVRQAENWLSSSPGSNRTALGAVSFPQALRLWGRPPWTSVAVGPAKVASKQGEERADEGVGRRPGGLPHSGRSPVDPTGFRR